MWRYNHHVLALYASAYSRDCWVYVDVDAGAWYQLYNANFDAIQYMITMLTHAKANNRPITFYENPLNTIFYVYVW
jgi:hypothetical protein